MCIRDRWVDTSDVRRVMQGRGVRKRVDWRGNRVRLVPPASYERYVADADALWDYGYERAREAYALAAQGGRPPMRNSSRLNEATR